MFNDDYVLSNLEDVQDELSVIHAALRSTDHYFWLLDYYPELHGVFHNFQESPYDLLVDAWSRFRSLRAMGVFLSDDRPVLEEYFGSSQLESVLNYVADFELVIDRAERSFSDYYAHLILDAGYVLYGARFNDSLPLVQQRNNAYKAHLGAFSADGFVRFRESYWDVGFALAHLDSMAFPQDNSQTMHDVVEKILRPVPEWRELHQPLVSLREYYDSETCGLLALKYIIGSSSFDRESR